MLKKLAAFLASFVSFGSLYAAVAGGPAGSFIRNQNTLQAGTTFYVSSGTVTNLNTTTLKFNDGTTMTTAATGGGGGGGGSSALGVFKNGVQVSSPTAQINFSGSYWGVALGGASTATITLVGGNTNYIQNSNTLQSGATFYVSSGTVNGNLEVYGGTAYFRDQMSLSGARLVDTAAPSDGEILTWETSSSRWKPLSVAYGGGDLEIPWKDDATGNLGWDSSFKFDYNTGILYAPYINLSSATISDKLRITGGSPSNYAYFDVNSGNLEVYPTGTETDINSEVRIFSKGVSSVDKLIMNDYGVFEISKDENDEPNQSLLTLKYVYDDGFTQQEVTSVNIDDSIATFYIPIDSRDSINASAGSGVNFFESLNNEYVSFQSSETLTYNQRYILPSSTGSVDQVLAIHSVRSDGKRALYWKTDASGSGGSGATIRIEDGGAFVVDTSTFDFTGTQFNVTNNGGEGLIALNGSSVTLGGVLTAGSNITITPGTGITTIAATGGSGSSIYPATSTVVFPFGVSSTTGVFTSTVSVGQKLGIQNTNPAYAIEIGNLSAGGDTTFSAATGAIVNSNSTNVTKFMGENTAADGSGAGAFVGLIQNDGTAVTSGDRIGGFSFSAYDGVDRVRTGAAVIAFANGTYSATSAPTKIDFEVASTASTTRSAKLSVNESSIDILSGTSAQQLRLYEPSGSGTNYSGFKSQAQTGDVIYTLPAADGSSNYVLSTNGSGTLSWVAQSGSGGGVTVYPATSTIIANAGGIQASTGVFTSTISVSAIVIGSGTAASPSLQFSPDIFTHKSGFYEVLSPHASIGLTVDDIQDVAYFGSTSVGFKGPTTITDYADPNNTILNLNGGSVNTYIGLRNNSSLPAILVGSVKNAGEDQYFSFAGSANGLTVSSEAAKLNTTTTSSRFGYFGLFISTPNARLHVNGDAIIESTFTVAKSTIVLNGTTYYWNAGAGSNGQFLKTDGAAKPTLTWGTAGGSSGFNYTFPASQANLPGANAPYISNSTNAASAGVFFDESSTQTVTWATMLNNYNGGTLYSDVIFTSSATSGTMNWGVYVECKTPNTDALDYDTDSFSTVNSTSVTVGATSGMAMKATVTLTNQDSCANGDTVRVKLERRAGETDTAIGKGRVRFLRLYE